MVQRLSDRVALVTGASRGIGRAIAIRLAADGAKVIVNYARQREAAEAVVAEINGLGQDACAVAADVRDRAAIDSLVEFTLARYGGIDILVNNAGIEVIASILDLRNDQLDTLIDVHVKGSLGCAQAVAPHFKARRSGRIVNVSSVAGLGTAIGSLSGYAIAKSAVNMLTKRLAFELGSYNVTVNAIAPGTVKTEMLRDITATSDEFRDFAENISRRVLLGRMADPAEIAAVAAFLASDDASYMTGQVLTVDGGRTDLLSRSG